MMVRHAKQVAQQWVTEEGSRTPGFQGAFYHGSTNWLADDAVLPATSDLDIMLVLDGPLPTSKLGKFLYQDVLLEVSYLARDQIPSPEQVLGSYYLAGSFHAPGIILDPTGHLSRLQTAVSENYARQPWVRRRCEHAQATIGQRLQSLQSFARSAPLHDVVTTWLFAAGVTTHVLLVAGLKNSTVRRRYVDVRELLTEYNHRDFYPALLEMLGCHAMSREQAEQHLAALIGAFDAAKSVLKTAYPFAADLSDAARPVAIDGSRGMIQRGDHREAVFWILATYSRCQWVLTQDAPLKTQELHRLGYQRLLADLGIETVPDLQRRGDQVHAFLPRVWEMAETIMSANPAIVTKPRRAKHGS